MSKRKTKPGNGHFKANRRHNTRRYKAHRSGITYGTSAMWSQKVIRYRIDPETGEKIMLDEPDKPP